jgi:hypothetical protein
MHRAGKGLLEREIQEINSYQDDHYTDKFVEYLTSHPCCILDFFTKRSSHRADDGGLSKSRVLGQDSFKGPLVAYLSLFSTN